MISCCSWISCFILLLYPHVSRLAFHFPYPSFSCLISPAPHPLTSMSVYSLCPPSCLCQFPSVFVHVLRWCHPVLEFSFDLSFAFVLHILGAPLLLLLCLFFLRLVLGFFPGFFHSAKAHLFFPNSCLPHVKQLPVFPSWWPCRHLPVHFCPHPGRLPFVLFRRSPGQPAPAFLCRRPGGPTLVL